MLIENNENNNFEEEKEEIMASTASEPVSFVVGDEGEVDEEANDELATNDSFPSGDKLNDLELQQQMQQQQYLNGLNERRKRLRYR